MSPKTRVLIVDDDVVMAKYLATHLSRRSFEVSFATGGPEALRIFRNFDPSLVLLDMSISGMTGDEIIQRLGGGIPGIADR